MFGLDFGLQFGFMHVNTGWYVFGRVCYVVFFQCDEVTSCFVWSEVIRNYKRKVIKLQCDQKWL